LFSDGIGRSITFSSKAMRHSMTISAVAGT
jgi:hypothetical protein